jgi:butyryl-CoA dehydrogenase
MASRSGIRKDTRGVRPDRARSGINGSKAFITNSGSSITSLVTITARTGDNEISTIIVPSDTPGFIVEPGYRKMGWRASDTHGLTFEDCRVPAENLLGDRGKGFHQFLSTLDDGRIAIGAMAVGVLQACLDESIAYANDREAFGRPIGANQAVAFKCADLAVMTDAARMLVYRAAWLKDNGQPFKQEAAIAKLYSTEAAVTATREATQIFGGYGFIDETLVSRHYRDAKILEIGEGTSEIQRLVISRGLGLPVT